MGFPTSILPLTCTHGHTYIRSYTCSILDDKEFYEKEEPFRLSDLIQLSQLLNQIAFNLIWKVWLILCVQYMA